MSDLLEPGDVFLTRGHAFISRAIRFFTRGIGEKRTKVNHVGLVVEAGDLKEAIVVEALSRVKRHRLWLQYGPPKEDLVAVHRATNLTPDEVKLIVAAAEKQVGKKYGYLKIVAHFLDWMLLGAYVFRRLVPDGKYPICSWLVAYAFGKADKHFGVEPGAATPDDIWDFIEGNPDRYQEVRPLTPLVP
ncbi:MAG: hypothetical protein JSV77_03845 [Dehalococcoidales bacterium]|nr:MAG: hypothetical protein JSV77_03845 [Dehalococcoidales bacterium]